MMRFLSTVLVLSGVVVSAGNAQEVILWRANNDTSATLVPAYTGQATPFATVAGGKKSVSASDSSADAAEQARIGALRLAEKLLSSKEAFQPDLNMVKVGGRVEGQAGVRVLMSNQWVGVGQRLGVRLVRSARAQTVIGELREHDKEAAAEIETRLDQRLSKNPKVQMVVKSIGTKEIKLDSEYGPYAVPVPSAERKG